MEPPFIRFYHYENIISCSFQKHLLYENGKTCPLCMNVKVFEKGKVTVGKDLEMKSCG